MSLEQGRAMHAAEGTGKPTGQTSTSHLDPTKPVDRGRLLYLASRGNQDAKQLLAAARTTP